MMHPHQAIDRHTAADGIDSYEKFVPDHKNNAQNLGKAHSKQHTKPEDPLAALQIPRAKILAGKGYCRLGKSIGNIICKIFKIQRQGGSRNGVLSKGIDPALDKYIGHGKNLSLIHI